MMTIKAFYFEPNTILNKEIEPIFFEKGLNIILGERSLDSEKMNSVGKSLLIEMINYCLLTDKSQRINKIPLDVLSEEVEMCLDIEIENKNIIQKVTIKRKRNSESQIVIITNNNTKEFEKLDEAKNYLETLIFSDSENKIRPSLRNLMSILIREEKSSFDDILRPYASKHFLDFSTLIKPHLYLFGFDIGFVDKMKDVLKTISEVGTVLRNVNRSFKEMGIDVKAVRSYINDLKDKVDKLNFSNSELKPAEAVKQSKEDLQTLEAELERVAVIKSSKLLMMDKIKRLPRFEKIDTKKIEIIYETFREGLGDLVGKSLQQVIEFHERIEIFQSKIFDQRLKNLVDETIELDKKIDSLDMEISKIYRSLGADRKIDCLKKSLKEEREKNEKLDSLSGKYKLLEQKKEEKKMSEMEWAETIKEIDRQIKNKSGEIFGFENDLKNIHEAISGNKSCQFAIKTTSQQEYIYFDYRIDLDGGSGMDRIRTFIYDVLLMINETTSKNHLGFLIHDNIFPSTGRDDMVRSLNYLNDKFKQKKSFQYIVTLNKDEFEAQIGRFNFTEKEVTKAIFTRELPFLKTQYREN